MPHIEETLKPEEHEELASKKDTPITKDKMDGENQPTLLERITEPVKNLFKRGDSMEKKEESHRSNDPALDMMNGDHTK